MRRGRKLGQKGGGFLEPQELLQVLSPLDIEEPPCPASS